MRGIGAGEAVGGKEIDSMKFARWVFTVAGVYGLLALGPMYFLERRVGIDQPPAVTHPEFYYGFVGVGLAWQVLFLIVARDPVRFRPVMVAAVLEKVSFAGAVPVLYGLGRVSGAALGLSMVDAVWGVLFVVAYVRTARKVL